MHKYRAVIQPEEYRRGKQHGDGVDLTPTFKQMRRDFMMAALGMALVSGIGTLSGCATSGEPGLRIATNQWIGYELLYLSREISGAGAYPDSTGVHLVELLSNTDSIQALAAGSVDGAGLTLDEAITARAAGMDIQIVLVFDFSAGADVLLARPGISHLGELKGKRIGVEQTGVGALMLDAALKLAKLTANDVNVIGLTLDQHLPAFHQGRIDALVTFEPIATQVEAAGGQRLFDSSAIPDSIVDVLAISTQALRANPQTTRQLLAHYFEALRYLRLNPDAAAKIMAPRLGLSPAALLAGYRGLVLPDLAENRRLLGNSPAPLETTATHLAELMLREKMLSRPVDVTRFIADSYLPMT